MTAVDEEFWGDGPPGGRERRRRRPGGADRGPSDPTDRDRRRPWWLGLDVWVGLAVAVACCVFVAVQLQPKYVVMHTTPNGGDLGAHVWWPAYLRDHLLPFHLTGWSPDFYNGFPAGTFYFPVPALLIVGLSTFLHYGVAFKIVVCLGAVLVPIAAWCFGRGIQAPEPTSAAMAVAATAFLFFTGDPGTTETAKTIAFNQRIMGGNLASTLAGEFSFTLAVALALFFLGALAWSLRTRAHLWLPAVLLAACLTSHLVVGIFAFLGALAVWSCSGAGRTLSRMAAIGAVGVLITAVWLFPLATAMRYTTNMRYGPLGLEAPDGQRFTDYLFPKYFFEYAHWEPYRWGAYVLIAIAVVTGVAFLRRSTFVLVILAALTGLTFRFWTDLGSHVWNLRVLSFWYISVHLLMAVGVAEVVRGVGWGVRRVLGGGRTGRSAGSGDPDAPPGPPPAPPAAPTVTDAPESPAGGAPDGPVDTEGLGIPSRWVWNEDDGDWTLVPLRREDLVLREPDSELDEVVAEILAEPVAGADPPARPGGGAPARSATASTGRGAASAVALVVTVALTVALAVGALVGIDHDKGFLPYWAKWNFSGYENTTNEVTGTYRAACTQAPGSDAAAADAVSPPDAAPPDGTAATTTTTPGLCTYDTTVAIAKQWPEYRRLMSTLGTLPPGRSLWEGGSDLDKFGTPDALMLIPYWTDGRIGSAEGLYYEASATTPYTFEAIAALVAPGLASNPVRGVPYRDQTNFSLGVSYLQAMGVRYFLARSGSTVAKAEADPRLTLVASTPDRDGVAPLGWSIFEVAGVRLVEGLSVEPVVATGVDPGPEGWEQEVAAPWWWFPDQLDAPVVADGPVTWSRAPGWRALGLARTPITPARVHHVTRTRDTISFSVDTPGRPVLVRESWFPNWKVEGAGGPYRTTPNYMVVVPTGHRVTLRYGATPADWAGRLGTLLGLAGLVALVVWGRRTRRRPGDDR